mgnify:CR=1 FL=1
MITQIVIVKKDRHANLDSFPFRYGFSEADDFELLIEYDSKPIVQNNGSQQRLRVDKVKFTNPITGKAEEGDFVLVREAEESHYTVLTVIRTDKNVDKTLSEVLILFRKHEYVSVENLIDYFHPLYINGKIKTHHDLKKYLIMLNSDNEEKINEIELVLKDAYTKIKKLELEENNNLFKNYNKYANSEEYSRDRAIAFGWGEIYDEAKEYADATFNEYLQENNDQIKELETETGERVMFFSWTQLEESMREEHPEATEEEIKNIMEGFRIQEHIFNKQLIENLKDLKNDPEQNVKEIKDKKLNIELSESEFKVYKHWQETIGNKLDFSSITKLKKD